jgi:hypothetical protein
MFPMNKPILSSQPVSSKACDAHRAHVCTMSIEQIDSLLARELARASLVHDTARRVREVLDSARRQYGAEAWDAADTARDILDSMMADAEVVS